MTNDLASILIVTRNDEDIIERNLQSVFNQTYPNIEIVIVDSSDVGSPSTTKRCIRDYNFRSFKVKYAHTNARGVGAARNEALRLSSGKYIFFVDADCHVPKDYVKQAMEIFSRDDKLLSINIRIEYYPSDKGMFARSVYLYEQTRYHYKQRTLSPSENFEYWVCKKEVFDRVGLFDDNLEAGEDTEWISRSKKFYQQLREEGYKAVTSDITMCEDKQGWSFRDYWRKSMWYGGKFADLDYLKHNLIRSVIEIIFMLTQVMYPVTLIFFLLLNSHTNYLFVMHTFVFFAPTLYILCRAAIRKIVSITFLLTPLLIFYKSVFLILGALGKAYKNIRQRM